MLLTHSTWRTKNEQWTNEWSTWISLCKSNKFSGFKYRIICFSLKYFGSNQQKVSSWCAAYVTKVFEKHICHISFSKHTIFLEYLMHVISNVYKTLKYPTAEPMAVDMNALPFLSISAFNSWKLFSIMQNGKNSLHIPCHSVWNVVVYSKIVLKHA